LNQWGIAMNALFLLQIGGLIAFCWLGALFALWLFSRAQRARAPDTVFAGAGDDIAAFLFDGETLVNATEAGERLLLSTTGQNSDFRRLLSVLAPAFPDLESELEKVAQAGRRVIRSVVDSTRVIGEFRNGLLRVSVIADSVASLRTQHAILDHEALQQELDVLRATTEAAPFLCWRQSGDGTVTWANRAYVELACALAPERKVPVWPPARLFELETDARDEAGQDANPKRTRRLKLSVPGEAEDRWFEVSQTRVGSDWLFLATTADKVVKAETALHQFIQTLTKTFAQLSIGLAVFDRQRRLTLFNPALGDLTGLPAEFLAARPTLHALLDRLRDTSMIPEPKDYHSWRRQMQDLEAAAEDGSYEETWSLPNGSTYHVVGRPHPDGALAFLFEDKSAEVARTRAFHAQAEITQAVLDSFEQAVAVFSPAGALITTNRAYDQLWGCDAASSVTPQGIGEAVTHWTRHSAPSPIWGDAREFALTLGERKEWSADARLLDGRRLGCRFTPIPGGFTLIRFTIGERVPGEPAAPGPRPAPLVLSAEKASL